MARISIYSLMGRLGPFVGVSGGAQSRFPPECARNVETVTQRISSNQKLTYDPLVVELREGIGEARECLQQRYSELVRTSVTELWPFDGCIENIVRDTFAKVCDEIKQFNPVRQSFENWLSEMAREVTVIALLKRCRTGDEAAWRCLYKCYCRFARSVVTKNCRFTDEIDGIVQDTFCKVIGSIQRFDSARGSFEAWLSTIARNTAISRVRKLLTRDEVGFDIEEFFQVPGGTNPEETMISRQLAERIMWVVDHKFTAHERLVFMLFYDDNESYKDIARITGHGDNTKWVANRLQKGRAKIRKVL